MSPGSSWSFAVLPISPAEYLQRSIRNRFLTLAIPFFSVFVPAVAGAAWAPNGVPASTAAQQQRLPAIVTDGVGGVIIAWDDYRGGTDFDIYAQRLDGSGKRVWHAGDVVICNATGAQGTVAICIDGTGGAIIAWADRRTGVTDIYAQRVDASGTALWAPNGVVLCSAPEGQHQPKLISDELGGAIAVWGDGRNIVANDYNWDIYAQRVSASGTRLWGANGVALCTETNEQLYPALDSDGAGGAIFTWSDFRSNFIYDVYAQRVNASGTPLWVANGATVCTGTHSMESVLVADGTGGAILAWTDYRAGGDIYCQRLDALGNSLWTPNGVALCTAWNQQLSPSIARDGAGGAIVTWCDLRIDNVTGDVYSNRVDNSGTPLWATEGVALCTAAGDQLGPRVARVLSGAVVTWMDHRSGTDWDIYAQLVSNTGFAQWAGDGLALCTAGNNQSEPAIATNAFYAGSVVVAWMDQRNDSGDIYAVVANGNTPAASAVVVYPVDVTTGSIPLEVAFDSVTTGGSTNLATGVSGPALPGTFQVGDGVYYNLSTTAEFAGNVRVCIWYNEETLTGPEAGVRLIHYDTTLLPPSWVDITTSLDVGLNRVCGETMSLSPFVIGFGSVTAADDLVPSFAALRQNVPNPFNPSTSIGFEVTEDGTRVHIRIYDAAGRHVRTLVDRTVATGVHTVEWNGRDKLGRPVASGVYFCRMDAGAFQQTRKMVLLR